MELKPGYKQTEAGVIPEEWDVHQICDIANVKTGPFGSSLHERDYVQDGTPIITVEHLGEFGVLHSNLPMVSESDEQRLKAYALEENDIVFSRVGSIDRNALIRSTEAGWLFSGRLLRVRLNAKKVFAPYLSYHLHAEPFKQRVRSVAVGQTMPSLNTQILNGIDVLLPPLPEQRAIAGALGDVDALLGALEKLIAKKHDLKQAAMQQLLTGQQRLPGFHGESEVKRLGDVADLRRENVVPADHPNQLFVHFSLPAFDSRKVPVVEPGAAIGSNKFRVPEGAILVSKLNPRIPRVWAPTEIPEESISSTEFLVLVPRGAISRDFLHVVCSSPNFCEQMELAATGTTGSHQRMNPTDALAITLSIPRDVAEQTAIAAVLSDMDAEIAAIEARLGKTRALKQGMMQELLTGRIRLV